MYKEKNQVTVFEHQAIRYDKGEKQITKDQFDALEKYYGEGVPYFKLQYHGIQFMEYVGVIQVGKTLIEVLPKAEKHDTNSIKWRTILIDMLKAVGNFDVKSTSESNLKISPNNILDLYFEMFINEVEYLLHNGLIKKYRKKEGNVNALKGNIQFGKHIQQNLTHQERFYVRYITYDVEHTIHHILFKTIRLLQKINTNSALNSKIGALLLNFPEMPEIKITEAIFNKLVLTRKTNIYKRAIEISKLLLLQYHPDLSKGRDHVLALMFDMNTLWEEFVLKTLRKDFVRFKSVTAQTSKFFWKPQGRKRTTIRPDILIQAHNDKYFVIDTKWKNLNGFNPSADDLRQLFVYHEYYAAEKVALVYPGLEKDIIKGKYLKPDDYKVELNKECSVILLDVPEYGTENIRSIKKWQEKIQQKIGEWTENDSEIKT